MAALWDPRAVLNTYPDSSCFTCVGITKKGARCRQAMISGDDLDEASQILDTMASFPPKSRYVRDKLSALAFLTLCPRWHRKSGHCQVAQMERKWQIMIDNYCAAILVTTPTRVSQRYPQTPSRSASSISTNSSENIRTRRSRSPSPETVTEYPIARPVPRRPIVYSTPPASYLPTPPTTPTRQRSAPAVVASPTASSPTATATAAATVTATATATAPAIVPPQPSTPVSLTPPPTPCSRPHRSVVRKPIDEPCGICLEPMCCPDEVVWCRAQCGKNLHRECFGNWRRQCFQNADRRRMDDEDDEEQRQENRLAAVTCGFCRATWKWEWQD
jgi:hypothetical protein